MQTHQAGITITAYVHKVKGRRPPKKKLVQVRNLTSIQCID